MKNPLGLAIQEVLFLKEQNWFRKVRKDRDLRKVFLVFGSHKLERRDIDEKITKFIDYYVSLWVEIELNKKNIPSELYRFFLSRRRKLGETSSYSLETDIFIREEFNKKRKIPKLFPKEFSNRQKSKKNISEPAIKKSQKPPTAFVRNEKDNLITNKK